MKKKKVNAHEYLNTVLKSWTRFCKTHRLIAESIQEVLNENKLLKAELDKTKEK